jgi:hypothetical protein
MHQKRVAKSSLGYPQTLKNLPDLKTILHKKCRSGKNSEGSAENSWLLDPCPAK